MNKRVRGATVVSVLRAFADFLENSSALDRACAADQVNELLDDWAANDAFGTEGQCDPRGDQRTKEAAWIPGICCSPSCRTQTHMVNNDFCRNCKKDGRE